MKTTTRYTYGGAAYRSVLIGDNTNISDDSDYSIVIGGNSSIKASNNSEILCNSTNSIAIGREARVAVSNNSIAIGYNATVDLTKKAAKYNIFSDSIAIGTNANSSGSNCIAIGHNASARYTFTIGTDTNATTNCIAIGTDTNAANNCIAIGSDVKAIGGSIGIGTSINVGKDPAVYANDSYSIAIGRGARASHIRSIVIGDLAGAGDSYAVVIGPNARVTNHNSISIGTLANTTSDYSMAIGYNANSSNNYSIAIGHNSIVHGVDSTAIGSNAVARGNYSIAIGSGAVARSDYSIAIGSGAVVSGANSSNTMMLGGPNLTRIVSAVTTITSNSDERLKENIELANTARCLEDIERLPVKRYKFKKFAKMNPVDVHVTGFIAQDVQKVFPKSVVEYDQEFPVLDSNNESIVDISYDDDGNEVREERRFTINNVLSMDTSFAIPTMWAAIQELSKRVKELESNK